MILGAGNVLTEDTPIEHIEADVEALDGCLEDAELPVAGRT